MKNRLIMLFSQYFGLIIGIIFAFGIGTAYAVLQPNDVVISSIIFISLAGWLIYIIKFVWDLVDKRKIKQTENDIKVKIVRPTNSGGEEEIK